MSEKSNTQQQQTGTRLSSYTSGYGITGNENEMLRSNNDQRVHDYKNMVFFFKKLKLTVLVRPLSAIQSSSHTLTLTFPVLWVTLGNLRLSLSGKTILLPVLCAAIILRPGM